MLMRSVGSVKPQVLPLSRLWSSASKVPPPEQLVPDALFARIVFLMVWSPDPSRELPLIVTKLSVRFPSLLTPAPVPAVLPLTVTLVSVAPGAPASFSMPPPATDAMLPLTVTPLMTSVEPRSFSIPPPWVAVLPVTITFVSATLVVDIPAAE